MSIIDKEPNLAPQKEQEIVNKILQRAELAQMTRQLRLGLSKVASPKKNKGKCKSAGNINKQLSSPIKTSKCTKENNSLINHPTTPPTESDYEKKRILERTTVNFTIPEPHVLKPDILSTDSDRNKIYPVPTTPRNNESDSGVTSTENEMGADLLMYLAASPYNTLKSNAHQLKFPSTPLYSNQTSNAEPTKPLFGSPQSNFRTLGQSSLSNVTPLLQHHSNLSDLIESPQMTLCISPGSHKRTASNENLIPPSPAAVNIPSSTHPPGTPSRDLKQTSSHILKTPNFNMNDYIHNLFSPSPRVDVKKD